MALPRRRASVPIHREFIAACLNGCRSNPAGAARGKEAAFMKRILLVLAVMALLMLALAAPAFADVLFLQPPGAPAISGHDDAAGVAHCNSPFYGGGGSGVLVLNSAPWPLPGHPEAM